MEVNSIYIIQEIEAITVGRYKGFNNTFQMHHFNTRSGVVLLSTKYIREINITQWQKRL